MTTLFDILNTINEQNNSYYNHCKRQSQCSNNKSTPTQTSPATSVTASSPTKCTKRAIDILPALDVTMLQDKVIIEVELAGVSKNDIEIEIKDSILTIQGEKKTSKPNDKEITKEINFNGHISNNEPSIEEFEEDIKPTTSTTTVKSNTTSPAPPTPQAKKYITERSFGYFKRYLDLNKILYQLDLTSINTTFENGLLTITINKKLDYSNTIKIEIN